MGEQESILLASDTCVVSSCAYWDDVAEDCALKNPTRLEQFDLPVNIPNSGSFVLAAPVVGRAMADHGRLTFVGVGSCMRPCMRPGDILHVASHPLEEIVPGDVAVCIRPGQIFAHRVVAKGEEQDRPFIITRPDMMARGDDGRTFANDYIGVVTTVERKTALLGTQRRRSTAWLRLYLSTQMQARRTMLGEAGILTRMLSFVQLLPAYRRAVRFLLSIRRARKSFVVRLPLRGGHMHGLHHPMSPKEFCVSQHTWLGVPIDCWTLALHLNSESTPAAWMIVVRLPPECNDVGWTYCKPRVRRRFRGLGLHAELIRKTEEILARGNGKCLS